MKKILKSKLTYIVLALITFLIYILCNIIAICSYGSIYENKQCDVAIVLGAAASDNGVSQVYKQRLNHAIELYNNKSIEKIIVTGGKGEGNNFSDAFMAKKYLVSHGIPEEIIILEEQSAITQENLQNSKKIMDAEGYKTALVVSDPLHMKRAMLLAKDTGIDAYSSPTQSSAYQSLKTKIPFVARETFFYVGYKWYKVLEFILIYVYTMFVTSVIGLFNVKKQKWCKKVPFWLRVFLIIPVKNNVEVPIYLVVIHGIIQLLSILSMICLKSDIMAYQTVQKYYGLSMIGIVVLLTIICNKLSRIK